MCVSAFFENFPLKLRKNYHGKKCEEKKLVWAWQKFEWSNASYGFYMNQPNWLTSSGPDCRRCTFYLIQLQTADSCGLNHISDVQKKNMYGMESRFRIRLNFNRNLGDLSEVIPWREVCDKLAHPGDIYFMILYIKLTYEDFNRFKLPMTII